jgi:WD40 repeat protein
MNKLSSIETLPLRNIIGAGRLIILLFAATALNLSAFLSSTSAHDELEYAVNDADSSRDMLAYVSDDGYLMLYDPHNRTETTLLDNVQDFVLGRDGRVAFTKQDENDPDLYVFDPSTPAHTLINISENPAGNNYPLAWSPDGRYLAFDSYQDRDDHYLYVWDGETKTNIMPDNGLDTAYTFYVDWSHDGQLAFTVQYGWSSLDTPSEIYLWDSNTTTNLSQNPLRWDGAASWSRTGQLKFGSHRDEEVGIYVWDGVSFKDGFPDIDSFIRLAPELEPTNATWTDDGFIGFTVTPDNSPSGTKEIILWDLESEAIVQQFPVSSENAWSWLAEGGQVILSSHLASGIPSVYLDVENTEGEILFSTHTGEFAWSSDGYLAYCGIEGGMSRILSLWDGEETWVVARVSYKPIQWQHGRTTFSCNNG